LLLSISYTESKIVLLLTLPANEKTEVTKKKKKKLRGNTARTDDCNGKHPQIYSIPLGIMAQKKKKKNQNDIICLPK